MCGSNFKAGEGKVREGILLVQRKGKGNNNI